MSDKFKNKYRIQSHRMPHWDYSANGMYFITLVTQNRECNLGKIINDEMLLSDWGNIVNNEWLKSFDIRRELFCDEYIIMPNHLHAIVILDNDNSGNTNGVDGMNGTNGSHGSRVETHGRASLEQRPPPPQQQRPPPPPSQPQPLPNQQPNAFFRKPKSLSSFIAGFKSAVNSKIDDYIDEHHLDIAKYNRNNHFF